MVPLNKQKMLTALAALDAILPSEVRLVIGGGGAMLLAHDFPLSTSDIDAVPKGLSSEDLSPLVERVGRELGLPSDWLNPWFQSFTYVLPADFATRLLVVYSGTKLTAEALGKEDLLLMKCFAHRHKDIAHARALVRAKADIELVSKRIEELLARKLPEAQKAADFLGEILDMEGL